MTHNNKDQEEKNKGSWLLDRHVNIASLIGIMIQTGGFVWWAATMQARVEGLERDRGERPALSEKVVRLEENMIIVKDTLKDLNEKIISVYAVEETPKRGR